MYMCAKWLHVRKRVTKKRRATLHGVACACVRVRVCVRTHAHMWADAVWLPTLSSFSSPHNIINPLVHNHIHTRPHNHKMTCPFAR